MGKKCIIHPWIFRQFLFFFSPWPRGQVWILIIRNRLIRLPFDLINWYPNILLSYSNRNIPVIIQIILFLGVGRILFHQSYDYRPICILLFSMSYQVIAKETQSFDKYSSNATVFVNVEDRNDNSPLFVKPFYNVTLKEELPTGTPVVQV